MKEFLKKYKVDIIVVGILLIASLIGVLSFNIINNYSSDSIAAIYSMNQLIEEIDLSKENEPRYFFIEGKHGDVKIEVKKDEIRIVESTCPSKSCILEGLAKSSKPIICAYNEIYIELKGDKSTDVELGQS